MGQTTRRVDAIVSASAGCVLVIDDIDQLADASDNFAREAISALAGAIKSGKASIVLVGETSAVGSLVPRELGSPQRCRVDGCVRKSSTEGRMPYCSQSIGYDSLCCGREQHCQ